MDPYSILGVPKTASQEEIKKSYRRLAMEFHPDRNESPTAEERFKQVSEAYSLIGTPSARESYEASQRPSAHSFDDFFSSRATHGNSWDDLFGAFRNMNHQAPPFVIKASLGVTLEEIYHGSRKTFSLDGQRIEFSLPKTSRPGQTVRIDLQTGQQLHMNIELRHHPLFVLVGDDLHCSVVVPVDTAINGGDVQAPTLTSDITLKIPPGTNSHSKLRAKSVGLASPTGGRTAIIYEVKIDVQSRSHKPSSI